MLIFSVTVSVTARRQFVYTNTRKCFTQRTGLGRGFTEYAAFQIIMQMMFFSVFPK